MLTRTISWTDQSLQFIHGILYWVCDTLELGGDVLLEIGTKIGHFVLAIFGLIFQVMIFLRDLCVETMHTFANLFQGIINVISSVSCEDVEDFASACIVVLLWVGAIKIVLNMLSKNPGQIECDNPSEKSDSFYDEDLEIEKNFDLDSCPRKLQKRKKPLRRHNRSRVLRSTPRPEIDEEQSD